MLLFCIYFNLLLSYASGIVPFGYSFRSGQFVASKVLAVTANVLLLLWVYLDLIHHKMSVRMRIPKVGMQDVIHTTEGLLLNGNCVLIGVQQLVFLENYQQLLIELLTNVRSWEHRHRVRCSEAAEVFTKLIVLPVGIYSLYVVTYGYLVKFEVSAVRVLGSMVTLIPNMVHMNNFYVLLFAQRSTLREINDQLGDLWTVCTHSDGQRRPSAAPSVAVRLQGQLLQYQQCASILRRMLRFYSLPVLIYLLILLGEVTSKLFYQFTFFYSLHSSQPNPYELELMGTAVIVLNAIEIVLAIRICYGLSEESHKIKSAVHRLSLVAGQDEHFHHSIEAFLLWLNHTRLEVNVAGMFTLDFEMLFAMIGAVSNFVILLTQFEIAYSHSGAGKRET